MAPRPPKLSRVAVVTAGWSGDEPVVREALTADDSATRGSALGALARLGTLSIADVSQAMGDASSGVRRRALGLVPGLWASSGTQGRDELVGLVVAALRDPDAAVVETACFAAGELAVDPDEADPADDPTSGTLAEALVPVAGSHDDHLCRESAVAALGALGHPTGRAAVLAACGDRATVRRRAVLALAAFEGDDVDAALAALATDVDWQVRQGAEDLLGVD